MSRRPFRAAFAAAAFGMLVPAAAQANHHACPVVGYEPAASTGTPGRTHEIRYSAGLLGNVRIEGAGVSITHRLDAGTHLTFWAVEPSGQLGNVSVARKTCTPFFALTPVGGAKSPLPSGANVPVPWVPLVPAFQTPQPPNLGANGDIVAVDPLNDVFPDLSVIRPDLGGPGSPQNPSDRGGPSPTEPNDGDDDDGIPLEDVIDADEPGLGVLHTHAGGTSHTH